jgi:hypothetical protein
MRCPPLLSAESLHGLLIVPGIASAFSRSPVGDALLGLVALTLVLARSLPVDGHDLQRSEQPPRLQSTLGCDSRQLRPREAAKSPSTSRSSTSLASSSAPICSDRRRNTSRRTSTGSSGVSHERKNPAGMPCRVTESHIIGAEHLRSMIAEIAHGHDHHVGTLVITSRL